MHTYYTIDQLNRIVDVGGSWDDFSDANGGRGLKLDKIRGNEIWAYISGLQTRSYLNAVFFVCRFTQKPVSLVYRCDSPTEVRYFRMTVTNLTADGLHIAHDSLLDDCFAKRKVVALSDLHSTEKCSICCALKVDGTWVDPFVQPEHIEFPKGSGLCPDCKKDTLKTLEENGEIRPSVVQMKFATR